MGLTDHDGPDVDCDKQGNVGELLQRENKGEDMVRHTLRPAIQWVESMACVRCRHDPFVMWLMQSLVHQRMVQPSVNPVDEEIRKQNE